MWNLVTHASSSLAKGQITTLNAVDTPPPRAASCGGLVYLKAEPWVFRSKKEVQKVPS